MKLSALRLPLTRTMLIVLMLVSVFACSKINRENYDKLEIGMEYDKVVSILGEPASCEAILTAKRCIWGKPPKTIDIKLIADKVVLFSNKGL